VVCLVAAIAATSAYPVLPPVQRMIVFLAVSFATLPAVVVGLRRTPRGDLTEPRPTFFGVAVDTGRARSTMRCP
jgi:hypothetical protein